METRLETFVLQKLARTSMKRTKRIRITVCRIVKMIHFMTSLPNKSLMLSKAILDRNVHSKALISPFKTFLIQYKDKTHSVEALKMSGATITP